MTEPRNLTCGGCGGEEFNIKFKLDVDPDVWAECAGCGRRTRAIDPPTVPRVRESNDRARALKGRPCAHCDEPLDEDIMISEGEGPMHAKCWAEWMGEQ